MNDLRELYQEVIFDHYRRPRNAGMLEGANREAEGYNPLCGDKVKIYLKVENDVIREVHFDGSGCAISTASASLMTENLKGKTVKEAQQVLADFHAMVTGHAHDHDLGKLEVLAGVREFPQRVKCATLAWHTLEAALEKRDDTVTTE